MGDRLVLVKRVERVEDVLIRSKVLCVTSDTEGRTLAVLEAFMSGAAVVATGVGDLAEVVEGSGGGVTVPPTQDEWVLCNALATAVQDLLDNEPRRAAAADRGRSFVCEAHSFARSQADWKRILDAVQLP
jgi:glycosyltransferase involved in cell wall biosynthesis